MESSRGGVAKTTPAIRSERLSVVSGSIDSRSDVVGDRVRERRCRPLGLSASQAVRSIRTEEDLVASRLSLDGSRRGFDRAIRMARRSAEAQGETGALAL